MGVCDIGTEQRWQLFNDTFLRVQELYTPQHKKSCGGGRKLVWLSKDLLVNLREKNEMYRQLKQGYVSGKEYKDDIQTYWDKISHGTDDTELVYGCEKKTRRAFIYILVSWLLHEGVPSLIKEGGEIAITDMEKAEVLNKLLSQAFHISHVAESLGRGQESKISPTVSKEEVWDRFMRQVDYSFIWKNRTMLKPRINL